MPFYSIRKSRKTLKQGAAFYFRKKEKLTPEEKRSFRVEMRRLYEAITQKKKEEAYQSSKRIEVFFKEKHRKTTFDHLKEFVVAIIFAIIVAFLIREFWFELYEVPTGSMRPTIEEKDRLVVSKTSFGWHSPFQNKLLLFDPSYLVRNGIVVFTVEGMDVFDREMLYFHLIPGSKRYIKRAVGLPGDTLYFYGGKIYGFDREKNEIKDLYDEKLLKKERIPFLEHIPYISFDGRVKLSAPLAYGVFGNALLHQMNLPVGKLSLKQDGKIEGQFFDGKSWINDDPNALKEPHTTPKSYSDLWGIGNYAMARLLTPHDVETFYEKEKIAKKEDVLLFLELHHTPNLTSPTPEVRPDETGRAHPMITSYTALIPLKKEHLEAISKALSTSRFCVENGHAYRYHESGERPQREEFDPRFPQVPDGCYEFEEGIGYKVHFGGLRTALSQNHALYDHSPENIRKLFNLGIHFNTLFEPIGSIQPFMPQRFAYYRDGDLYILAKPVIKKDEPTLTSFVTSELEKQKSGSYVAFIDRGPPLAKNGELDKEFIEAFGLKIPDNALMALGDNYAMSADSRDFGFVPLMNLRGSPAFIFWPFGPRVGPLAQPPYPFFILPRIIIYIIVLIVAIIWFLLYRKRNSPAHLNALLQKIEKE